MKLLLSTGGGVCKDSAALAKYYIITFCRAVACIDYPSTKIMNMVVVGCGRVEGCERAVGFVKHFLFIRLFNRRSFVIAAGVGTYRIL